ncbi:unnamed protein product, partial [marine sediment metagenome]
VRISGECYKPYEEKISLQRGVFFRLEPELEHTEEYRTYLEESEKGNLYASFEARILELESILEPDHRIVQADLDRVAYL